MLTARVSAFFAVFAAVPALAQQPYLYTAETQQPVRRAGVVVSGKFKWECQGLRCTTRERWPAPSMDACQLLAREVGAIRSFGRDGSMMTKDELAECNGGTAPSTKLAPPMSKETPLPGPKIQPSGPVGKEIGPVRPGTKIDPGAKGERPTGRVTTRYGRPWRPAMTSIEPESGRTIYNNSHVVIRGHDLLPIYTGAVPPSPGETTLRQAETKTLRLKQLTEKEAIFSAAFGSNNVEKWYRIGLDGIGSEIQSWTDSEIRARLYGAPRTGMSGNFRLLIYDEDTGEIAGHSDLFHMELADSDSDGHDAMEAGGDDCNDRDRTAYPGAIEVADFEGHDEDCNPDTIGNKDEDRDRHIDDRVFNWTRGGERNAGDDCDDGRAAVHPGNTEACNGRDDNCNGEVDEELIGCPTASR